MVVSPDNRMLFTSGSDGAIFVFTISEQIMNIKDLSLKPSLKQEDTSTDKKAANKDPRLRIVDPDLADIVFVKKDQMEQWQSS